MSGTEQEVEIFGEVKINCKRFACVELRTCVKVTAESGALSEETCFYVFFYHNINAMNFPLTITWHKQLTREKNVAEKIER